MNACAIDAPGVTRRAWAAPSHIRPVLLPLGRAGSSLYPAFTERRVHQARSSGTKAFIVSGLMCFYGPQNGGCRKSWTWVSGHGRRTADEIAILLDPLPGLRAGIVQWRNAKTRRESLPQSLGGEACSFPASY